MGAKCSTGMGDSLINSDPVYSEVRRALDGMIPKMLDFQVSGSKKDFEHYVEPYCKDNQTRFVFSNGKVSSAEELANATGEGAYSKAEIISVDTVRVFADDFAAVATITVKCGYECMPGTYEISRNTFAMSAASMNSDEVANLDKGQKVDVEKIVKVGERLRGKIRGKDAWITINKDGSETEFATFLKASNDPSGELFAYSTVLEKIEEHENQYEWKLVHVTMQSIIMQ